MEAAVPIRSCQRRFLLGMGISMNQHIIPELYFFAASASIGVALSILYDLLRVFRRLCRHSLFLVSAEDFFFWLVAGVTGFSMVYVYNDGIIRLYSLMAMLCASVVYYLICSRFLIWGCMGIFRLFLKPAQKGLKKIINTVKIVTNKMLLAESGKETEDGKKKQKKKKHRI